MVARSSTQALGEALPEEIERRPRLMQGWGLPDPIEENFVGVAVVQGEAKIALAGLGQRARGAERGEQLQADVNAQRAQDIFAIAVAFVYGWSRSSGGLGDSTHGQCFFAAASPQPASFVKNSFFQSRIRMPWQSASIQ
jgi:hypothetical protein